MREGAHRGLVAAALAALAMAGISWMSPGWAKDAAVTPPATEPGHPAAGGVGDGSAEGRSPRPPTLAPQAAEPVAIADHMRVAMDYTLTVEGKVVDTSTGRKPLEYVQGSGQIIPGLERQLAGLHVGDEREVTVNPEDGYGAVNPSAITQVAKEQLPKDLKPEVGMMLQGTKPDGRPFRAMIRDVHPDGSVTLDLNHPLAGKTLQFKVKVVSITPPPVPSAGGGSAPSGAGPSGQATGGGVTPPPH